jgi:uncharacterized protein YcbK (DUF882 family)
MNPSSRRAFLKRLALAAPAVLVADRAFAAIDPGAAAVTSRALTFHHTHTGERLAVEYFARGSYIPDALVAINWHLRDFRTGDQHVIDPALLDLLHRLQAATGSDRPFEVISGYRSPKTNQQLREKSTGVAASSLHMAGKAIDIRLGDVKLPALRAAAIDLRAGGVGYYPDSQFVHVDTGRIRAW